MQLHRKVIKRGQHQQHQENELSNWFLMMYLMKMLITSFIFIYSF